ncbi:hypothetical protein [Phycicoccus sp. Soil748]|nr:hypothetical protein [Phycicoccus sp. Soil748]
MLERRGRTGQDVIIVHGHQLVREQRDDELVVEPTVLCDGDC